MQTTHSRKVSVLVVAMTAPNADMSLIWLFERLQNRYVNNLQAKKTSIQTTHSSVVSVVLVAKAAPNADMSLIRLFSRLQSHDISNAHNKKPAFRQLTPELSACCWWPGPLQTLICRLFGYTKDYKAVM